MNVQRVEERQFSLLARLTVRFSQTFNEFTVNDESIKGLRKFDSFYFVTLVEHYKRVKTIKWVYIPVDFPGQNYKGVRKFNDFKMLDLLSNLRGLLIVK